MSHVTAPRSLPDLPTGGRSDVIAARDAAILARLKTGPVVTGVLRNCLPQEPGKTPEMRIRDCANALTRLQIKKLIVLTENGWTLA